MTDPGKAALRGSLRTILTLLMGLAIMMIIAPGTLSGGHYEISHFPPVFSFSPLSYSATYGTVVHVFNI